MQDDEVSSSEDLIDADGTIQVRELSEKKKKSYFLGENRAKKSIQSEVAMEHLSRDVQNTVGHMDLQVKGKVGCHRCWVGNQQCLSQD